MTRTSRLRRRLHVVEPSPIFPPSIQQPAEEPPAVTDSEIPQPDGADPDIDGALSGMSMLLRVALRLMKSYNSSPSQRERGR